MTDYFSDGELQYIFGNWMDDDQEAEYNQDQDMDELNVLSDTDSDDEFLEELYDILYQPRRLQRCNSC